MNASSLLPTGVRASTVVHQEGVLALLALIGLGLRDGSPLAGLAPRGALVPGLTAGLAAGLAAALVLAAVGRWDPLARLQEFQRRLVAGWSTGDAALVAVFSGLAEEALVRALLQPLVGLLPAAVLFALLHVIPDKKLWLWPVLALGLGLGLGLLFERWGWPAAALAHAALNAVGLLRLRRAAAVD